MLATRSLTLLRRATSASRLSISSPSITTFPSSSFSSSSQSKINGTGAKSTVGEMKNKANRISDAPSVNAKESGRRQEADNGTYKKLPPPDSDPNLGRIIAVTSGKGGVGKTTSAASFALGLAMQNPSKKVCVIDFDIGLRNLDIHLGAERRVVFDFINVINFECTLNQALIKDKKSANLSLLAASQTKDKDSLTVQGVEHVLASLVSQFDYVILDSPAGIESGAKHAMYFADDAIIVTNPELSSCRDADKMIGFISARSRRAEEGAIGVKQTLLITRYDPERADKGESLSITDIQDLLGLELIGVIPESKAILTCTNLGTPVITLGEKDDAAGAYGDMCMRYSGGEVEWRFTKFVEKGFFSKIFGK